MPAESVQADVVDADDVLETDLADLSEITLADLPRFGAGALGHAVQRILTDTGEQVANFCNSM